MKCDNFPNVVDKVLVQILNLRSQMCTNRITIAGKNFELVPQSFHEIMLLV